MGSVKLAIIDPHSGSEFTFLLWPVGTIKLVDNQSGTTAPPTRKSVMITELKRSVIEEHIR
jgi:hypothetical protein